MLQKRFDLLVFFNKVTISELIKGPKFTLWSKFSEFSICTATSFRKTGFEKSEFTIF